MLAFKPPAGTDPPTEFSALPMRPPMWVLDLNVLEQIGKVVIHYAKSVEPPVTIPVETIADKFARLTTEWKRDTARLSVVLKKVAHPAYQRIIGMGSSAVPLILRELQREEDHWFWALESITEASPCPPTASFREATEAWLRWGRDHGQVQS